jgi:Non-histone chromosomal protein MC1
MSPIPILEPSLILRHALRERGTKKVHVFKAWKQVVKAPKIKPAWMPEKISKPFVKKERIETIE